MSRCTHAKPLTNSRRNQPPAIEPAPRPPEFFTSAMSDFSSSRYSSHSGNGQQRSPARSPASRTSASSASSFPISPIATCPSATTTAPVSVAASITAAGLKRRAYDSASHRMSRPSASVLMISMVLPRWLLTTSPGFTAVPDGRFSVAGIRPTTFAFGLSAPRTSNAPSTAAAPDMSYFMSSMLCRAAVPGLPLGLARKSVAAGHAAPDAPPRVRLLPLHRRHHDRDRFHVGFGVLVGPLQLGEGPRSLPRPLDRHLSQVAGAHRVARFCRHGEMEPRRAERAGAPGGHRGGAPHGVAGHLAGLPDADQQDPLRLSGGRVAEARLVPLPLEVAARDRPSDQPA